MTQSASIPASTPLSSGRANNFDFLRFMLATLVIFSHSYQLGSGSAFADPLARLLHSQMSGGGLAVDFFFVISGFLVTKSWQQSRTATDFAIKRGLRIYPGFVAILIFCVFLVGPLGGADPHVYFKSIRTYKYFEMLLLRPGIDMPTVFAHLPNAGVLNASLWTIRFELMCYIGVMVLGGIGAINRRWMILAAFVASLLVLNLRPGLHLSFPILGNLDALPRLVTYFLAGAVFHLYRDKIPKSSALMLLICFVALAATLSGGADWTLPIFGTYAIFQLAFSRMVRFYHFARFGDFSYGMYLYAYPFQQLLVQHFGLAVNPLLVFGLSFVMTLACAIASWHLIENQFLKLKPRYKPVAAAQPVAAVAIETPVPVLET